MLQAERHGSRSIITRVLHSKSQKAGTRLFVFSLVSLLSVPAALNASRIRQAKGTSQAAAVRDESDPDGAQYCQSMGGLQIPTTRKGPMNQGWA